jgi:hypothetical protein
MLSTLSWSGVVATILLFRRLKHVAGRIPSRALLYQSNIVGSQLPIATLLVASFASGDFRYAPEAFQYAILTPLPGVGLPWPLALRAHPFDASFWDWLFYEVRSLEPDFLIFAWAIIVTYATLFLAIQFLIALIRVRRADHELSTYSRALLTSQSPSKNPIPPEPIPASSV